MVTVAKNKLINQFRKMANDWNTSGNFNREAGADNAEAAIKLMNTGFEQQFNSIFSQLPKMQKKVFYFAKHEGMSYTEIASKLTFSPLTMKTHMARALDRIRKSLKQYGIN